MLFSKIVRVRIKGTHHKKINKKETSTSNIDEAEQESMVYNDKRAVSVQLLSRHQKVNADSDDAQFTDGICDGNMLLSSTDSN